MSMTECRIHDRVPRTNAPGRRSGLAFWTGRRKGRWALGTIGCALAVVGGLPPVGAAEPVDFAHQIAPLIKARCARCHTDGTYKGSLSLDTREALLKSEAVVPGRADQSDLVARITSDDPEVRMPPEGARLSAGEVELVKAWIDQGAPWPAGISFRRQDYVPPLRPRRVVIPPAARGAAHPIDRILEEYRRQHNVEPAPELEDAALVRRAYLDVLGVLPPVDVLDSFLRDPSPDKRQRLVRRLLDDSTSYADHWLTFWNDLLRNDYRGTGYTDGGRKQITTWLYQSLAANKPYDQLVRELIDPSPESEGFVFGIKWRGRVNASQGREIQFAQNVSQVLFGINMKCASCHDSFIDSWKLDDAYALAAVVAEEPLEIHRCDKATGRLAQARFLWPELGAIDAQAPRAHRLRQLAALVTHPENGRFQRTIANRLWQRLMGRGIVHPVDVMANRPWSEDLLDYLGTYLADHGYDLKQLIEHVLTSRAYQSQVVVEDEEPLGGEYVFRGPTVKRLTAEQFIDAVWGITQTHPATLVAPIYPGMAQASARKKPSETAAQAAPPAPRPQDQRTEPIRASLVHADLLMRSLGRPNREQVVTTRGDALTTLQALDLANGAILAETLSRGAANLLKRHAQASGAQLVEVIYLQALSRRPTRAELDTALELLGETPSADSLADFLWIVFMLPEFQLVR